MPRGHDHPVVELLAHISAPSGARDDAGYAAQIAACMGFEAETRTNVLELDYGGLQSDGDTNPSESPSISSPESTSLSGGVDDSIRQGEWPTLLESDDSPDGSPQEQDKRQQPKKQEQQEELAATPTGLYDITFTNIGDDKEEPALRPPLPSTSPVQEDNAKPGADCRPHPFETPPTEVPDSHSTIVLSQLSAPMDSWMEAEVNNSPPLNTRNPPPLSASWHSKSQSQTPKATQVAQTTITRAPSPSFKALTSSLPLTITSTEPTKDPDKADKRFKTHITRPLAMIVERIQISRVFNPTRQTRQLARAERGYWGFSLLVVDYTPPTETETETETGTEIESHDAIHGKTAPNIWCAACFVKFWDFLRTFVGENRAGWGVWCVCEPVVSSSGDGNDNHINDHFIPDASAQARAMHHRATVAVTVKVFAWGEMASHIWVLLYLASDRKVRRVRGVEWRDANGEPVICMT